MNVRCFVNGLLQTSGEEPMERKKENREISVPASASLGALIASHPFIVISVGNCSQCEELAAFLAGRGVPSTVFVKWDKTANEYPSLRAALAMHAGEVFTFPQVFLNGAYQGGMGEVIKRAERGAYDEVFEKEFGVKPSTLQRWVERQAMVVFSLPNCPQCDVLYADLENRGVPSKEIFVKLDKSKPEYPSLKAQMQKLIGCDQFTFPQTFIRAVHQGSFAEVIAKAEKGEFAEFFSEHFGIPVPAAPPSQPPVEAAMAFDDDF